MQIADRLQRLSESQTIAMSKKARELKAEGRSIISLSLGEPDFDTPEPIKQAAIKAINENFSHYTAVPGYEGLIKAIQLKFKRDNGLDYQANQIIASTGAKQSLINALLSTLNPGDEVIIPCPYWVSYLEMVKICEASPVFVEGTFENDFKLTADQLRSVLNSKTRAFFFNSPSNPTGSVYTLKEMQELAKVLEEFPEVLIISDEIYEHINYSGEHHSFAALDNMFDRTVTVNGVSKAFAMTGWRLGYLAAPAEIAAACSKMQGQFTSATCGITQKAAEAALIEDPKPLVKPMLDAFRRRRELMVGELSKIPGFEINESPGAFYLFPKVSAYFGKNYQGQKISDSHQLCMYLLEVAGVACVSGDAFGAPDCLRISYAASDSDLKEACKRLQSAFSQLS